ncbi:glycosyltransferase [Arthrobacter sp. ISL-48]|uniref:glycosyltransferase n=1 Tax=Arthrobacter sp. ISL-48 TaxID=2819110 RepID=UPI001BEA4788|nr:glycosyltransferase [Arthrobacter sp. ISL-48]MBT2533949.1 glycosyltransferase [Arthrobacter sp. ISL-48]
MLTRVALDARRQRDNGVARVTRLLAVALSQVSVELVLFGPGEVLRKQFPCAEVVEYGAPLLSDEDLYGLDTFLQSLQIDCLIAPQFYNSPWTECPQVRILHDTFPLETGTELTDMRNVESTFGHARVRRVVTALLDSATIPAGEEAARLYKAYYDLSVEKASALLTVSDESFRSIVHHYPGAADKLEMLPLFPDPAIVSASLRAPRDKSLDAIHVSKFEPRKNQLTLLRAWTHCWERDRSFRACIVGSPSTLYPEYTAEVLHLIGAGRSGGWLEHHQGIDDQSLAELYGSAKIACVASTAEGFGLPALEGMANGCIVVALPGTSVDEVCGDFVIHASNSPESIAGTLADLLSKPGEMDQLSQASRTRAAAARFTVAATAKALDGAIRRASTDRRG